MSECSVFNNDKLHILKEGNILRYKKRLFTSNWKLAHLTLFDNASFLISNRQSKSNVTCKRNSTLIIFGQQLCLVPKRPNIPNGFKLEQMLGIGLINHLHSTSDKLKSTQIIFYWFLLDNLEELVQWVIAFRNSLTGHAIKVIKNGQLLNQLNQLNQLQNEDDERKKNDTLSFGMLIANTTHFNNSFIPGIAAVSAAGHLASSHGKLLPDNLNHNLQQSFQSNSNEDKFAATSNLLMQAQPFSDISDYYSDMATSTPNHNLLNSIQINSINNISTNDLNALHIITQTNNLSNLNNVSITEISNVEHSNSQIAEFDFDDVDCPDTVADFSAITIV